MINNSSMKSTKKDELATKGPIDTFVFRKSEKNSSTLKEVRMRMKQSSINDVFVC